MSAGVDLDVVHIRLGIVCICLLKFLTGAHMISFGISLSKLPGLTILYYPRAQHGINADEFKNKSWLKSEMRILYIIKKD